MPVIFLNLNNTRFCIVIIQVVGQDLEEATRKFRKFIEKISIKLNKCKLVYANFTNKYNQHLLPIKIDDAQYPTKTCTETLRTNS